jgi:hypothetical protein
MLLQKDGPDFSKKKNREKMQAYSIATSWGTSVCLRNSACGSTANLQHLDM